MTGNPNVRFTPAVVTAEISDRVARLAPGSVQGEVNIAGRRIVALQVSARQFVSELPPPQDVKTLAAMSGIRITPASEWQEAA